MRDVLRSFFELLFRFSRPGVISDDEIDAAIESLGAEIDKLDNEAAAMSSLEERVAALESFVDHCKGAWYAGVDSLEELRKGVRRHVDLAIEEAKQDFMDRLDGLRRDEQQEKEENL